VRFVFLGPPGAGKSTQAKGEAERLEALYIATGDELRSAIAKGTSLGQKAKSYIDSGRLVPDDVIIELVRELLERETSNSGVVFDGFPRTIAQAEALDRLLEGRGERLDAVVYFETSPQAAVERLGGRRVCRRCATTFHVRYNPPQRDGVCDKCGGELFRRDDDEPQTVRERLRVYEEQTAGLLDYYTKQGLLVRIDANETVEQVRRAVRAVVSTAAGERGTVGGAVGQEQP